VKGWGQRTFAVQRPPTRTARELQATWGWFEAQSVSYVAHPSFPFDLLAVPEGGSFNPKKPQQNLLVRVQPQGADRPLSKIKSGLGDHEPRPDGSFDVPLKKTPLGAVVVLSVTDDAGQTHETTLRFSMSARDFEISVVRAKNKIDVLVTSLLSSGLEDDGSAIPVFCSLFMGDAVLATRQGWLPAPKEQSEISFELDQAALKELVAVGCDSSPLFSALDSASLWAFPEAKPDPNAPWLEALYKGLEDRVGAKVAGQFRDDLLGEDEVARARARRFINQLLPPKAPGMAFVAGSYVDDQRALHKKYRMRRLALMITLVIVLLTWLYMTLYALKINRSERLSALDFLDDGTAQGLEESQRAELFSRPKSGMLATSVVLVMILSMVGLIWVLFWL